jgi:hypothetical protein
MRQDEQVTIVSGVAAKTEDGAPKLGSLTASTVGAVVCAALANAQPTA